MKVKYFQVIFICYLLASGTSVIQAESLIDYLNARGIDDSPKVIGEGVFSTNKIEFNTTFSADELTMLFSTTNESWSEYEIMMTTLENGVFNKPKPILVDGKPLKGADPHINWNGDKLFFVSPKEVNSKNNLTLRIWHADFDGKRGFNAKQLNSSVINNGSQSYPITNKQGDVYFSNYVADRSFDIFVSNNNSKPISVESINSDKLESDFFIAPDNHYAIFVGVNWHNGFGISDLYIIFNKQGQWSSPLNLGSNINSKGVDGSPYVTKNNQYLIFTSNRKSKNVELFDGELDIYAVKLNIDKYRLQAVWTN